MEHTVCFVLAGFISTFRCSPKKIIKMVLYSFYSCLKYVKQLVSEDENFANDTRLIELQG